MLSTVYGVLFLGFVVLHPIIVRNLSRARWSTKLSSIRWPPWLTRPCRRGQSWFLVGLSITSATCNTNPPSWPKSPQTCHSLQRKFSDLSFQSKNLKQRRYGFLYKMFFSISAQHLYRTHFQSYQGPQTKCYTTWKGMKNCDLFTILLVSRSLFLRIDLTIVYSYKGPWKAPPFWIEVRWNQ